MPNFAIHLHRALIVLLTVCGLSHADKTLMWLTDWYQGNLDSVVITSVSIQHYDPAQNPNGFYYGNADLALSKSNAYAAPVKVNQHAPNTVQVPKALDRWWYAQPKYDVNKFREGRMNVELKFKSYQHTYWNPPTVQLQAGTGTGQTGELNWADPSKTNWPNQCLDTYPNDTIWFYNQASAAQFNPLYNAAADTVISQGYVGNSITCTDHNPFFVKVGTIHVYNPWPGSKVYVQQGGSWRPLFDESGRLGWQTAVIWADPRNDTTFKVRLASGNPNTTPGVQYMDVGGLGSHANGTLFDFSKTPGSEQWILPPTSSTGTPSVATTAPPIKTTLMIQRPNWTGGVRVLWKGNDSRFVASAATYCDWYTMPLYEGAVPDTIVLHSAIYDTLYGMKGLEPAPTSMDGYQNWIAIKGQKIVNDTIWIITNGPFAIIPTARPDAYLKSTCDTKTLAFSTYDYTDNEDSTSKTWYAPFAEGYSNVVFPTGSKAGKPTEGDYSEVPAKGIVKTLLNAQGRPEWTGKVIANIGAESHGPQHWYDPLWRIADKTVTNDSVVAKASSGATRLNAFHCIPVQLKLDPTDNYYKYSNGAFFPLDTVADSAAMAPYRWRNNTGNNGNHDFHYAMHAKATFEYTKGLRFKFSGDDDVWIFINKKLALDIGGMHSAVADSINLDKLGLTEGKSYQFDMFYNERHANGSTISIQTTMNLVPTINYIFDTSTSSTTTHTVSIQKSTTYTPADVCPENGAKQQVETIPARAVVYLLYPDGHSIEVKPGAVPGITINDLYTQVSIDTTVLKTSGFLTQGGDYQVKVTTLDASESDGDVTTFSLIATSVEAVGTLYDRDGDGRADSVVIHGDGSTPAFYKAFNAAIRWGGTDSTILSSDSIKLDGDTALAATISPLPLQTACPSNGCSGSMGHVWALSTPTNDTVRNPIVSLQDGIAPVADSAWLVYDTTGTGMDTLYVRASERLLLKPIVLDTLNSTTGAAAIYGSSTSAHLLSGTGSVSDSVLTIALSPATDPIASSDSVRLGSYVTDVSGNAPGARSRWVPISAKPHLRTWMLDHDGDGTPDSVAISAKGDLSSVDTLRVHWKTYGGIDTTLIVATPGGVNGGVKLPASTLQNATYCKGCTIDILGAAGLPASVPLADSVAPVPVKATLITAGASSPDTLEVNVSEGFKASGKDFVRLSSDSAGTQTTIPASAILAASVTGSTLRLIVASGTLDVSQDWLRLTAGVQDSTGATVGTLAKWVHLKIRPSGSASLFDADGDGRADSVLFTVRGSISSLNATTATLSWKDVDGRTIHRTWPLGNSNSGSFGLHPSDSTLWFPFGATSCPGSNCTIALGDVEWPLQDSVAPVALSGRYSFGTGTAPDTLRVKLSEAVTGNFAIATWAQFGTPSVPSNTVLQSDAAVSGDTVTLIVPVASAPSLEVERVRALSGIRDAFGNSSLGGPAWAPLSYGIPPYSVTVTDSSGKGAPDHVTIHPLRTVPITALPLDSVRVSWSHASGAELDSRTFPFDRTQYIHSTIIRLGIPFDTGATGCTLANCGATVFGPSGSAPATLVDSAAAVLLSAKLFYSLPEIARDTIVLQLSEPWTPADPASSDLNSALAYLGSTAQIKDMTPMLAWSLSSDGRTLSLVIDTLHSNLLGASDSAWLSPRSRDASGNHPASNSRRVPLNVGRHPAQWHVSVWPPLLKNEGASAWNPPSEGTPEFEILTRPHNAGLPWTSVGTGSTTPVNDTAHVTGIQLTLNRPLTGALYVFDQLGVAVNRFDLKDLAKLWGDSTTGTNDQTRDVWIAWNGTDAHHSFVASGVYLLRLVAIVETEPGKTELYNLLKKVGWSRK